MTQDLGPALDRELDTASPPTAITADGVIHKGRKQAASRTVYTGAASVIALALAAGLVFQLARGGPGADAAGPTPSASTAAPEQQAFPLPEVDLDKQWDWAWTASSETDATKELTRAWWRALSQMDGASLVVEDPDGTITGPETEETFGPITRIVEGLVEDVDPALYAFERGPAQGYTRPIYRLESFPVLFDGVARSDGLSATYYPRGSFLQGTKSIPEAGPHASDWRYLASGCEDFTYMGQGRDGWKADYTCAESAGPGGERVIGIELAVHRPNDSSPPSRYSIAVVYLADGNAVVVQDTAPEAQLHGESEPSIPDPRPGLTPAELAELAFAVPPVVVS